MKVRFKPPDRRLYRKYFCLNYVFVHSDVLWEGRAQKVGLPSPYVSFYFVNTNTKVPSFLRLPFSDTSFVLGSYFSRFFTSKLLHNRFVSLHNYINYTL